MSDVLADDNEPTAEQLARSHPPWMHCPSCDAGPNNACIVWPQYGKLYSGCEQRMAARGGELIRL
jgi:hypothetical protein